LTHSINAPFAIAVEYLLTAPFHTDRNGSFFAEATYLFSAFSHTDHFVTFLSIDKSAIESTAAYGNHQKRAVNVLQAHCSSIVSQYISQTH
jgi:hypothetical protein